MKITWRFAAPSDAQQLAEWNHALIREERHQNSMTVPELSRRMHDWLEHEYRAVIYFTSDSEPLAYALYRRDPDSIYLRQFYVLPERRRKGVGRECLHVLRSQIWPSDVRLIVEVLVWNPVGIAFWRAMGYSDYSLALEIVPNVKPA